MKTEHATAAIAAALTGGAVTLPDPVKTAIYTSLAAVVGWAVGAALSWLGKKLGVKQ
jgi:hypothetical protein